MIITSEQFWCPRCGRLPLGLSDRKIAPGVFGGWASITCLKCGSKDGDLVCAGDTEACSVTGDGFCRFHGNYVGANAHPGGFAASKERQQHDIGVARTGRGHRGP